MSSPIYLLIWEEKNYTQRKNNKMQTQEPSQEDITKETKSLSVTRECCGIYGLKNKTNGKWYIGQTINPFKTRLSRYKSLKCSGQTKIFNALKKYGYEEFEEVIIEPIENPTKELIDLREDFWIRHYDSVENGYNCRYGGSNGKMGEEAKQKIRDWGNEPKNKKYISDQVKKHLKENGHPWSGKCHSVSSREKMSSHDRSGSKSPSHGRIWINNGTEAKKIIKDQPIPIGFFRGRLFGTVQINNGIEKKYFKLGTPLPTGFVVGPLYRRRSSIFL